MVQPDILHIDYNLAPDKTVADLVKEVNQKGIEAPAILVTGQSPEDIGNELVEELFSAVLYKNTLTLHVLRETILLAVNGEM